MSRNSELKRNVNTFLKGKQINNQSGKKEEKKINQESKNEMPNRPQSQAGLQKTIGK